MGTVVRHGTLPICPNRHSTWSWRDEASKKGKKKQKQPLVASFDSSVCRSLNPQMPGSR